MPETVDVGRRDSVGARVGWSSRVQLSFRPGQADGFGLPQFRPYLRTHMVFSRRRSGVMDAVFDVARLGCTRQLLGGRIITMIWRYVSGGFFAASVHVRVAKPG